MFCAILVHILKVIIINLDAWINYQSKKVLLAIFPTYSTSRSQFLYKVKKERTIAQNEEGTVPLLLIETKRPSFIWYIST